MIPKSDLITIGDNVNKIEALLQELVLQPRLKALEWSKVTKQTPNMKIGYPGQHLASLITGIEGARTGARGDDLRDGTEVKSCSRVDQLDTCNYCGNKVLRIETICPHCESTNIKRMDDSKWLFGIRSESELKLLTKDIDRVFLTIADYPHFRSHNFDVIRIQAFEIWNNTDRHKHFETLMSNYYYKIFLEHKKRNANKTPAPKNFWPFSYQFYLCNPVKVFNCIVTNANTNPTIKVDHFVDPFHDRSNIQPESMPTILLDPMEIKELIENVPEEMIVMQLSKGFDYSDIQKTARQRKLDWTELTSMLPCINESTRAYLKLRDTDIISVAKSLYARRKQSF
ncbi:MamI family restriction endonuclease [Mucilaginibacter sp. KACC 22063]|uniref:MamI family restriction endonuclease n=1 Tax=Mucilaginibacter sp. KACC 22063 TaxID=3025666 RepID=UPI00236597F7|nr:MamI family restriction endonuclease [Mucilaginibacter sp. KACC 22063]WDF56097.1 MamI family restriction endonuclease [Mucilaginibacter sp. KACC 22063]